jgi:polyphosphate kinase 2 (PPK2 family)
MHFVSRRPRISSKDAELGESGRRRITAGDLGGMRSNGRTSRRGRCAIDPQLELPARVVALSIPSERERTQWYFQRYVAHLPAAGELCLFDRSWFNRAARKFERMLTRSCIRLFKHWFLVSRGEPLARFEARETDPLKQRKLSPIDRASLNKWDAYTEAKEAMFFCTDPADAPWIVIKSDDRKRAAELPAALPVGTALSAARREPDHRA